MISSSNKNWARDEYIIFVAMVQNYFWTKNLIHYYQGDLRWIFHPTEVQIRSNNIKTSCQKLVSKYSKDVTVRWKVKCATSKKKIYTATLREIHRLQFHSIYGDLCILLYVFLILLVTVAGGESKVIITDFAARKVRQLAFAPKH